MIDVDYERAMHVMELADDPAEEVFDLELNRGVRRIDLESVRFGGSRRNEPAADADETDQLPVGGHSRLFLAAQGVANQE